jgi:hypothetical protein
MSDGSRALALAAAIAVIAPAGAAVAGDWEIEFHGGGLWTLTPSSGQATSPPAGETFQTVVPGVSSRRVTSWYFGDGGVLLERKLSAAATGYNNYSAQYVTTVGPLDPVLSSASVRQPFGGTAGLRIGRRLNRRLTAELNLEYGPHAPSFSDSARADFEYSQVSFDSAWNNVLGSLPGSSVTSLSTPRDGSGHQLVATVVLDVNLQTGDTPKWSRRSPTRRFVSYLTFGAGIVSTDGEEASATLAGGYRFASPAGESGAPFEETDTVTVRSAGSFGTALVGVVGVGWKQDLSNRWGIRFDARAYLSGNPRRIVLDAGPSVTKGSPASAYVARSSIGAIQFVNDGSGPYEGQQSSLSGLAIAGLETFRGTGILMQVNVTLGVFLRF